MTNAPHIVVAGAGSLGGWIGIALAFAGRRVTLLGRQSLMAAKGQTLTACDVGGALYTTDPNTIGVTDDPSVLAGADLILVTVKSDATPAMAAQLRDHARPQTPIVSLQNGLRASETLKSALPGYSVKAGLAGFNVVRTAPGTWMRGTTGELVIEGPDTAGLAALLSLATMPVHVSSHIRAAQWSKLVINLNNAINAISDLPLRSQLHHRQWRALLRVQVSEALTLIQKEHADLPPINGVRPAALRRLLALPEPLYSLVLARKVKVSPHARSSMWEDLKAGRLTEIDDLQGEVLRLAETQGVSAPVTQRIFDAIRTLERTGHPDDLRAGSGDLRKAISPVRLLEG